MKLRILGNSLRLRLTRTEIAELAVHGLVENRVQLGALSHCALTYRVKLSDEVAEPVVVFEDSQICVRLPAAAGKEWAQNGTVGLYGEASWGLKLSVEKDFKCLDPRLTEDESDAFENPAGTSHAPCAAA